MICKEMLRARSPLPPSPSQGGAPTTLGVVGRKQGIKGIFLTKEKHLTFFSFSTGKALGSRKFSQEVEEEERQRRSIYKECWCWGSVMGAELKGPKGQ